MQYAPQFSFTFSFLCLWNRLHERDYFKLAYLLCNIFLVVFWLDLAQGYPIYGCKSPWEVLWTGMINWANFYPLYISILLQFLANFFCFGCEIALWRGVRSWVQCGCTVLAKLWRLVGCPKAITSMSDYLFQTRPDHEWGIIGQVSLLHSWHWVLLLKNFISHF